MQSLQPSNSLSFAAISKLPEPDRKKICGLLFRIGEKNPSSKNYLKFQLINETKYLTANPHSFPIVPEDKYNLDNLVLKVDRCGFNPHSRNLTLIFAPNGQRSYFFHGASGIHSKLKLVALTTESGTVNRSVIDEVTNVILCSMKGYQMRARTSQGHLWVQGKLTLVSTPECVELGKRYGHGSDGFLVEPINSYVSVNSRVMSGHAAAARVQRHDTEWAIAPIGKVPNPQIKELQEVKVEIPLDYLANAFPFTMPEEEQEVVENEETKSETETKVDEKGKEKVESEVEVIAQTEETKSAEEKVEVKEDESQEKKAD